MICTSSGKQITSVATSNYIFPHQFACLIAVVYNGTPTSRDSVNLSQKILVRYLWCHEWSAQLISKRFSQNQTTS